MLLYQLYYDIISLTSLKIIQAFHLLLGFAENPGVCRDFKFKLSSVRITEGTDNGDSDNRGPTVYTIFYSRMPVLGETSKLKGEIIA